jgi:hypothetical protein
MAKKRVYKKGAEGSEYAYHASPEVKKDRAARNKARREAIREGKATKHDGTHCDHIKPLSKGGSRDTDNTRVVSAKTNREKYNKTTTKKTTKKKGK